MQCPSCGRTLVKQRANCLYCGAALSGEAAVAAPVPAGPAPEQPVVPARPTLVCVVHGDSAAVGRCFRCRKGICQTCAFKIPTGYSCADCISAASEERKKQGRGSAIASVVLGGASIATFLLAVMMAASMTEADDRREAVRNAGCLVLLAILLSLVGLVLGLSSRGKSRGGSVLGLVGAIVNGVVLAIFLLLIVAGQSRNP